MARIKNWFISLKTSLLSNVNTEHKVSTRSFTISLFIICFSILLTICGQIPFFATRGITQIFQLTWVLSLIPLFVFSYKSFLKNFLYSLILVIPFLTYLGIATICKRPVFSFEGTKLVFLMMLIFFIGLCVSKFVNKKIIKLFAFSFLIGSLFYAFVLYFSKLRGADISGSVYAVSSKNSAGPIFLIASICAFYFFDKKNAWNCIIKYLFIAFFTVLIFMMKCRTVIVAIIFIIPYLIVVKVRNWKIKIVIFATILGLILTIVFVPQLNQRIIKDILLNGKTKIDDIFSGRLTAISNAFNNFKPLLGSGNSYIDCMPLCFLTTYGVIGLLLLLPVLLLPFIVFFSIKKYLNKNTPICVDLLMILFFFEILLEGFGYLGPGAKSFMFWLCAGLGFEVFKQHFVIRNKNVVKIIGKTNVGISKLNNQKVTVGIQLCLVILSVVAISTTFFGGGLAKTINSKLPSNSLVTDYYEPGNISLIKPVDKMCKGQRITIGFKAENEKYDDIEGRISTYNEMQKSRILVDSNRNELTGIGGWACFGYNTFRGKFSWEYYSVVDVDEYIFDKVFISSTKYSKSFDHVDNELIDCGINQYSKVYIDNFYVPSGVNYRFYSSDSTIASVDNEGNIFGVAPGKCEIYAEVTNKNSVFRNINKLEINVLDESDFVKTTNFNPQLSKNLYQYEPINISSEFNENATFTDFDIRVIDRNDYSIEGNTISFKETGIHTIEVIPIANPLLKKNIEINILENRPVSFSCGTNRLMVGNEYSAKDLGLKINYSSGNSYIISDADLKYNVIDFSGRAWHDKNGIVKNRTTLKTVVTGGVSLNLVSKIDESIKGNFNFEVSRFTVDEYKQRINNISLIFIALISIISTLSPLFIDVKKRKIKLIFEIIFPVILAILIFIIYGFTLLAIMTSCICLALALFVLLLDQLKLKEKPILILNDKEISNFKKENDFNEADI